ncbi:MAG: bifunctional riboflavin kinase/FAD synthetase [Oscillospiraceae bacterium]|nr:bifunctional riboflavin kinase/FAD synthetase [Oscillospiraceae bacterium]
MTNKPAAAAALGYFDGVHLGHKEVIKTTLSLQQYEPVVFTFRSLSPLPKLKNNNINITTDNLKHKLLKNLGVKHIYSYDFTEIKGLSPENFVSEILIKTLNAEAVCCGYDFRFGEGGNAGADKLTELCNKYGVATIIVPPVRINNTPVSSTFIRELITKGDIKTANKFLGYELTYRNTVIGGNKIGRTIGFPTINQHMPDECVLPRFGVYKSKVIINNQIRDGITNIGIKPTAGEQKYASAETYIIGFDGNLYGELIEIKLIDFIRDERKFNSFDELKEQIKKDLKTANGN